MAIALVIVVLAAYTLMRSRIRIQRMGSLRSCRPTLREQTLAFVPGGQGQPALMLRGDHERVITVSVQESIRSRHYRKGDGHG